MYSNDFSEPIEIDQFFNSVFDQFKHFKTVGSVLKLAFESIRAILSTHP